MIFMTTLEKNCFFIKIRIFFSTYICRHISQPKELSKCRLEVHTLKICLKNPGIFICFFLWRNILINKYWKKKKRKIFRNSYEIWNQENAMFFSVHFFFLPCVFLRKLVRIYSFFSFWLIFLSPAFFFLGN